MSVNPKTVLKPGRDEEENTIDPVEIVTLLGDEYTRKVIETIGNSSASAREISNQTDMSRPTVYRRINDLKDAGVIETHTQIDRDGHHKEAFELTLDEITLSIGDMANKAS